MIHVPAFWHPNPSREQNVYVAFQSKLVVTEATQVTLHLFGSDVYRVYCDGIEIGEGPARFTEKWPEYDVFTLDLPEGEHTLTIVAHHYGVVTRITSNKLPAFLQVEAMDAHGPITLTWRCRELEAYLPLGRRVNGQLGWAEFCDMRLLPDWCVNAEEDASADEDKWQPVAGKDPWSGREQPQYRPAIGMACRNIPVAADAIDSGSYVNRFGYEMDDPPVRFLLRDLQPTISPDGIWYRFDFGKVGLYRPILDLELPEGTKVETGYSEYLTDDRVIPVISLSASASCHVDRWIARGGRQTLSTYSPRGFRFLELHIAAPPSLITVHEVAASQRSYFGSPSGRFVSSDPLLDRIWSLGVETLQSCSEDALTDTPTRERGQWLGDAVAVGVETLSVAYGDLSLIRRSLEQAALCRRDDGMIVGCYPGQIIPVSSFAMLWVAGCMRYYKLSGDKAFLQTQFAAANDVVDFYLSHLTDVGIARFAYWDFIDWGHIVSKEQVNIALNVLTWNALVEVADWAGLLGEDELRQQRIEQRDRLETIIRTKMTTSTGLLRPSIPIGSVEDEQPSEPGFHANVLALRFGLFRGEERRKAVELVKRHMTNCFPNRQDAPRLAHPAANHPQLITPYFGHFALAALLEDRETDFVLNQYRTCWGWMLEQGATTLLEVFDHRWSHCHAWSACPSWQLSRYFLGFHTSEEGDPFAFEFRLQTGELSYASGTLPIIGTDHTIQISWFRSSEGIHYECVSDHDILVHLPDDLPYRIDFIDENVEASSDGYLHTRGFRAILT
ncbi:alpha-L-rhamnosidase-related protein [Paenibacillus koleovorans]|uniref:alpha-L-rhamnosidase-related protein n=1 Tax=Paenibacillus koleovorans TaxID=121608 RepID=UPI0013E376B0|nr:hypothetical protein [Paenibacillus koleovorans]